MTNNNENIVVDLKNLIQKYMSEDLTKSFINKLEEDHSLNRKTLELSEIDKAQVQYELPQSMNYRLLIDKVITYSEKILSKEQSYKLILDLAQLMLFAGENSFALEISENLYFKLNLNDDYPLLCAESSLMISKVYWAQALWDESNYFITEAMQLFLSASSRQGLAKCENMLGTLYGEKGKFEKAKIHFENALIFLKDEEDLHTSAMISTNLGIINTMQSNFEKAIWNYKNAIKKFEEVKDTRRLSRTYHNVGMLLSRMNNYDAALEEFNKCITLSLANNYLSNCAIAYIGKAFIYTQLKNSPLADAYADKAMEIACKINDTLSIADIYKIKGMIQNDMDNFELSEELFENSLRLNKDVENELNEAESSNEMGKLLEKTDRKDEAQNYVDAADNFFNQNKN
jgi:tetratricopeptide (TPR) repeat protein